MSADFRIEEGWNGKTILYPLTTMARAAHTGLLVAFVSSRTAQRAIHDLAEAGFTFEGDLPHDK